MGNIFYTSDTHFHHDFVAQTRNFTTAEEHDEALIENFNKVLTKRDQLWILGDVFMGSVTQGLQTVARIKGTKHLILGNHDSAHPKHKKSHSQLKRFYEAFDSVAIADQHVIDGHRVQLSHFPYKGDHADRADRYVEWRLRDTGLPLLHGHVHDEWLVNGNQFNVGVDRTGRPVPREWVADWLDVVQHLNTVD